VPDVRSADASRFTLLYTRAPPASEEVTMKWLRYVAVAGVASAATFGIVAASGLASQTRTARVFYPKPGDDVYLPALDLVCIAFSHDLDGNEVGPVFACTRSSAAGHSRTIGASKSHFWVTDGTGNVITARYVRAP